MSEQELDTPIDDIGALLAKTREDKGLSLASASMQTKLSSEIIEKLESNRFQDIGAPVFARGYLSIYARFLGLNQAAFTRAFNALSMDTGTELRLTSANVASQKKSYKRSPWKAWLALIPLFALAGVIVVQVMDSESWLMQQIRGAFATNTQTPEPAPAASGNGTEDIVLQIGTDEPPVAEPLPETPPAGNGTTDNGMASGSNEGLILEPVPEDSAAQANNVAAPPEAPPAPVVEAAQLQVNGETWLEVKSGTGRVVASAILKKGDTVSLPLAEAPFAMNIGRPADVVLMLGDTPVDLAPFKQRGSDRRFSVTFDTGAASE